MVAFLFGAGATKGAGGVQPEPPLGAELYERLQASFPDSWGSLITPDEDEAFQGDPPFEPGMDMLWRSGDKRVQRLIIDMALYFSDFVPPEAGSDGYTKLLGVLRRTGLLGRSLFATLNYDCTFEIAAGRVGIAVNYPATVGAGAGIPVLKPHGSCNFVIQGTQNFINVRMAGMGQYVGGDPPIEAIPPEHLRPLYDRIGMSLPPVISLYAPGKLSPVAENFVNAIRALWVDALQHADVVVIIGARPLQADAHVWEPVLKSKAEVWYIGGQSGDEYDRFQDHLGRRLSPLGDRFSNGIGRLSARLKILS
jgi:hypothetical protein